MSELNNDEVTLYIPFRLVTDSIKQIRYVVSIHFGYANSVCNPIVKFSQKRQTFDNSRTGVCVPYLSVCICHKLVCSVCKYTFC